MERIDTHDLEAKQPSLFRIFSKSLRQNRLAHAYLFEGESGVGKHEFALWLAQSRFCLALEDGLPCEKCVNCTRILEGGYPDVHIVEPDGQSIKVDQIRGLKAEFMKSGMESSGRVFLIKEAEKMNVSAANSLLKFLEEPERGSLAILETSALPRILPTIQSRCQIMHFQPLSKADLTATLIEKNVPASLAKVLPELTNSLPQAEELAQDEWFAGARDTVKRWFSYLVKKDLQAFVYVQKKLIKIFKEKEQQKLSFELLLIEYNQLLATKIEQHVSEFELQNLVQTIEEILQAQQKFASNVSYQNVLEQLTLRIVRK
ncbi:MAG: DNA polymerase III subunit delta' [Lactobacillales bacterium]|jgi:DNA polymerase-3 subunit delta'|nr:DNA polymerase III subunit delta' [Lactobacillales bacterium]